MLIPESLVNRSTGKMVLAALAAYYLFYFVFYMPFSPMNQFFLKHIALESVLDLKSAGYTPEEANTAFGQLAEKGRADYVRNLWSLDVFFPALAAWSSVVLILWCVRRIGFAVPWLIGLAWLPIAIMLCDYAENGLLTLALGQYPASERRLLQAASACTQVKWGAINLNFMLSLGLAATVGVLKAIKLLSRNQANPAR